MAGELILVNPRHKRRAMTAKQKKYFGPRKSRARRNPSLASIFGGGKKRRRHHARRTHARRNPIVRPGAVPDIINGTLLPAAVGAAGAVALDLLWTKLPIPEALKTSTTEPLTRIALGLGLGFVGGMVAGRKIGNQLAAGSLIVTMTDLARVYFVAPAVVPVVTTPAPVSAYVGAYVGDGDDYAANDELGWYSAGQASPRYAYG